MDKKDTIVHGNTNTNRSESDVETTMTKSGRVSDKADDAHVFDLVNAVEKQSTSIHDVKSSSQVATNEQENSYEETKINISQDCSKKLADGLMQNILPELEKAKASIEEAINNQEVLIETVQQENAKFSECSSMEHLVEMMNEARTYYNKLMTVKKDMTVLAERTTKLKKRAVKLQQQKQKEEQFLIQRRERELEKEQQLIARVVKKTDPQ